MRFPLLVLVLLSVLPGCTRGCGLKPGGSDASTGDIVDTEQTETSVFSHLQALGYVTEAEMGLEDGAYSGVLIHDRSRVFEGLNIYCSENTGTVTFMDMDGKVVRSVTVDVGEARWEDNLCKVARHVDDDSLVMVVEDTALMKVTLDARIEWKLEGRYHHDVDVTSGGTIHALVNDEVLVTAIDPSVPILDNLIVTLDPEGKQTRQLSLSSMVQKDPVLLERTRGFVKFYREQTEPEDRPAWLDVFHVNTVDVIDERIELSEGLAFEKGWILFCSRYLDLVGVIDPDTEKIVWHWGPGELQWPHHPSFVEGGGILVFDNGTFRKHSRLVIVDPVTRNITWKFEARPKEAFFSSTRGGAQMLGNGNILVTESDSGHVFEITSDGTIVWEFYNPDPGTNPDTRATIYRLMRL